MGLTVAVTGPTGEIGISAVTALEHEPAVDKIIGMARRPFDPAEHGWTKTSTGRATSSIARRSTRWSPTPMWSSTSRS